MDEKKRFKFLDIIDPYIKKEARTYSIAGNQVVAPYPKTLIITLIIIGLAFFSWIFIEADLGMLITRIKQTGIILGKIFNPNWSYLSKTVTPLIDTIQISIAGTIIGSVLAIPFAILSSSNILKNKVVYTVVRFIMSLIRTIPILVYALVLVLVVGIGELAGMIALILFTFGIVAKMLYEKIETISLSPVEAIESSGASKLQAFRFAVVPQVSASFLSILLYTLEINIRSAAILGYVGAGGIGYLLNDRMSWREYNDVGAILLVFFVMIIIIENISRYLRKKLG